MISAGFPEVNEGKVPGRGVKREARTSSSYASEVQ